MKTLEILALIFLLNACSFKNESKSDSLQDGWYKPIKTETNYIKSFTNWKEKKYFLESEPIISLYEIESIKIELSTEPDSSIEIFFNLTPQANEKYKNTIAKMEREELVFLLNDSLINFHMIYSELQRKEPLNLTLGYSDYNQKEIDWIISELKRKLMK
jgi:hypothetical protein